MIWKWLNGNKTIICTLIFGFISQFGEQIGIPSNAIEMILWIAGTLGLVAGAHHIQKGYLTTEKGD
jgi:hypothetical protein